MARVSGKLLLGAALSGLISPSIAFAQSDVQLSIDSFRDYGRKKSVSVMDRPHLDYDPSGFWAGSFLVHPEIVAGGGVTDNVLAAETNRKSAVLATLDPSITAESQWSRHSLKVGAGGQFRRAFGQSTEDQQGWWVDARGRIDIRESSRIDVGLIARKRYENRLDPDGPVGTLRPTAFIASEAYARGVAEFSRVRVTVAADVLKLEYDDTVFPDNIIAPSTRDQTLVATSARAEVAVSPDFAVFAQGGYRATRFDGNSQPNGLIFDSNETSLAIGTSFDADAFFRGEVAVGYLRRNYDNPAFGTLSGVFFKGRLEYLPTQLLTVTASAERSIIDAVLLQSGGYFSTRASLRADYEVLRNVVLTTEGNYRYDDYRAFGRRDSVLGGLAKARYLMNRNMTLNAQVGYSVLQSEGTQSRPDYRVLQSNLALTAKW